MFSIENSFQEKGDTCVLLPVPTHQGNVTAQWLAANPKIMGTMRVHLTRKYPQSAAFQQVDDHIGNFWASKIGTDYFRQYQDKTGRLPTHTEVCRWLSDSCKTDFRNAGRNPVTRTFMCAKTEQELKGNRTVYHTDPHETQLVFETGSLVDVTDTKTLSALDRLIKSEAYTRLLRALCLAIYQGVPKRAAKRYIRVFKLLLSGQTLAQVGQEIGVTPIRVRNIYFRILTVLRQAVKAGTLTKVYQPIRQLENRMSGSTIPTQTYSIS